MWQPVPVALAFSVRLSSPPAMPQAGLRGSTGQEGCLRPAPYQDRDHQPQEVRGAWGWHTEVNPCASPGTGPVALQAAPPLAGLLAGLEGSKLELIPHANPRRVLPRSPAPQPQLAVRVVLGGPVAGSRFELGPRSLGRQQAVCLHLHACAGATSSRSAGEVGAGALAARRLLLWQALAW